MFIALYILTSIMFLVFGGWFLVDPSIVPVIGMAISAAGLIGAWLTDEERKEKEKQYWAERRMAVGITADRVEKELDSLFALRGARLTGAGQRAAAADPGYDQLYRDVSLLTVYWSYRSMAQQAMAEIDAVRKDPQRDVGGLVKTLEKLAKRLRSDKSLAWA